ncbi:MAG: class I SAM-dependent methyltransferase [Thermomicrobiales bacterium]
MTTIEQLHLLQSDTGSSLFQAIRELDPQPNTGLAVISKLRKSFPPELVAGAMTMHLLRIRAREKFERADEMWFTRDGLEQSTSEMISNWRTQRFTQHRRIVDLCCGIGGDATAFARRSDRDGEQFTIVDTDPVHLEMAESNVRLHSNQVSLTAHNRMAEDIDLSLFDAVFIDPARRDDKGRHATGKSNPSLAWCTGIASTVPVVGVKLAPGLPHHLIPDGWGFETVAIGHDLKEAILWSPAMQPAPFQATVITGSGSASMTRVPGSTVGTREPRPAIWLYDPNPAITRAGLVEDLARTLDAHKIDDQIGFLVADREVATPCARSHRILASLPWHERNLQQVVRDLDGGVVVIRRRGLPGNVDDIQHRLRGQGPNSLFIAMTRMEDRPWAIVCSGRSPEIPAVEHRSIRP